MPPGEPTMTFADVSKADKLLGFRAQVGIEEGVRNFVAWYKERRSALVEAT
jgi:nucleoside-diphosphate-sugar epimerase